LDRAATETILRTASGRSAALDLVAGRYVTDPEFIRLGEEMTAKDLAVFDALCQSSEIDAGELREISAKSVSSVKQLRAVS
jgi:hypothetical protein